MVIVRDQLESETPVVKALYANSVGMSVVSPPPSPPTTEIPARQIISDGNVSSGILCCTKQGPCPAGFWFYLLHIL